MSVGIAQRHGRSGVRRGGVRAQLACAAWFALAVGMAAPVLADPLPMRSGEHRGFTRLTLPVPADADWRVGRVSEGYGVRLSGAAVTVDPSAVFTRIGRDRLAEVRLTEAGVDLVLACDCHAVAFEERGLLVVDLRDGPPPPDAGFEAPLDPPAPVAPAASRPRPGFDWTEAFVPAPQPLAGPVAGGAVAGGAVAGPRAAASPVVAPPPAPAPSGPAVAFGPEPARDLIVRQFSRAVAQGLIRADVVRSETVEAHLRQIAPQGSILDNLRIGATTGVDRARAGSGGSGVDRDGAVCPADDRFDLASWGGDGAVSDQIAAGRRALLGEFDRPEPSGVIGLARLYLHAGFGAEARALLAALPPEAPEAETLTALSHLIDAPDGSGAGAVFAPHVGCDGAVALWAVLGVSDLTQAGVIDRRAVRRAFTELPAHLRAHLGPPLAQRFLDIGDTDTALALRNAIVPSADAPLAVLDAGLELAQGRPAEASEIAGAAADGVAPGSAEALAVMVEARLEGGLPLAADTAEDLVTLAREHAGTALGRRLARLEAVALAEGGLFDAAFAVRDRMAEDPASAPAVAALSRDLVGRMAQGAGDAALLARVLAESDWRDGALPAPARHRLAERLLAAGFAQEALAALPAAPAGPDDARLAATALLALDAPARALRMVADQPDAAALRGAALLALGEHRAAVAVFTEADLAQDARRAAWLGGFWQEAVGAADDPVADLLALAAEAVPAVADPVPGAPDVVPPGLMAAAAREGELAQANAMLQDAARMRRMVADMLSAHPPPPQ